jgi:hypothetical protein
LWQRGASKINMGTSPTASDAALYNNENSKPQPRRTQPHLYGNRLE